MIWSTLAARLHSATPHLCLFTYSSVIVLSQEQRRMFVEWMAFRQSGITIKPTSVPYVAKCGRDELLASVPSLRFRLNAIANHMAMAAYFNVTDSRTS